MSIRVKCEHCGSVLKVKNELAGTTGKCPSCKGKLHIPLADSGNDDADANAETRPVAKVSASSVSALPEKVKPVAPPPPPPPPGKKGGDSFDVDAFLADDSAPNAKKSAGLASAPEPAKGPAQPQLDKYGRRSIVAPPPSPPKPGDTPAAASAASALTSSANARELLTKAQKEAGSASPAGLGAPKAQIDWNVTSQQLAKPALMFLGAIVACGVALLVGQLMFDSSVPMPRLAEVSGTVTLNKEPLANVSVVLMPVNPKGKSTKGKEIGLRTATGTTDSTGFYEIYYYEGVEGSGIKGAPADTKVRIGVLPVNPRDIGRIPEKYQRPELANDIREVKPAGNEGRFNIELQTTP